MIIGTLLECSEEDIDFWEAYFIWAHNSLYPNRFNISPGTHKWINGVAKSQEDFNHTQVLNLNKMRKRLGLAPLEYGLKSHNEITVNIPVNPRLVEF